MKPTNLGERLRNHDTREETLLQIGEWAKDTALLLGAKPETAFHVGWIFSQNFRRFCNEELDNVPRIR